MSIRLVTAILGAIAWKTPYPKVSASEEHGMPLQSQFHPLVALPLGVAEWEVCLGFAITGADDSCGLVNTTLQLTYLRVSM